MSNETISSVLGIDDMDMMAIFDVIIDANTFSNGRPALDTCKMVDAIDERFKKPEEKVFAAYCVGRLVEEGCSHAGKSD